jgi:hypothetical protein
VFHRLEHRIRAHVLICWLALLLTRVAERGSSQTWRNINRQLGRITQVTLAGPAGTVMQTTPAQPRTEGHLPGTIHPTTSPDHRLRPQLNTTRPSRRSVDTHARPTNTYLPSSRPEFRLTCAYELRNPGASIEQKLGQGPPETVTTRRLPRLL